MARYILRDTIQREVTVQDKIVDELGEEEAVRFATEHVAAKPYCGMAWTYLDHWRIHGDTIVVRFGL